MSWSCALLVIVGCTAAPAATPGQTEGATTSTTEPAQETTQDPTSLTETSGTTTTGESETTGTTGSEETTTIADTTDADSSSSGGTGTTGEPSYDCDALIEPFIEETELNAARGYHDVFFDQEGHLLGWDGASIRRVTYDDQVSVFLPGVDSTQGMDLLDNGDLLYADDFGELVRVTADLQPSTVANNLYGAYGVTVGPDQQVYVATAYDVVRIDPTNGQVQQYTTLPDQQASPRAVVFNLDSTQMYIATLTFESSSPVYVLEVDADLDPIGVPTVFAEDVGMGWQDGLGIDACGNLYVPEYETSGLYRIDPAGVVTTVFAAGFPGVPHYGHGIEWGSGIGGWRDDAVYLPQPYDDYTVLEVVLGVPSGSTVRTWGERG